MSNLPILPLLSGLQLSNLLLSIIEIDITDNLVIFNITVKGVASRLVSWLTVTTTSSAKGNAQREKTKFRVQGELGEVKEQSADRSGANWVMTGWPRVTCQRNKGRLYDDLGPRVDRKRSCAMMIGTKMNCRAAKRQSCDEDWTQVDCRLAKPQLCEGVCARQICWQTRKSRCNDSPRKGRCDGSLGNCQGGSAEGKSAKRNLRREICKGEEC